MACYSRFQFHACSMDFWRWLGRCHRGPSQTRIWPKLLLRSRAADRGACFSGASPEVDPEGYSGDFAGHCDLCPGHRLDDFSKRCRIPYARKFSELVNILLHEDLRQTLARLHGAQPDQRCIPASGAAHSNPGGDLPGIPSATGLEAHCARSDLTESDALPWRARWFRKVSEPNRSVEFFPHRPDIAGTAEVPLLPTGYRVECRRRAPSCPVGF